MYSIYLITNLKNCKGYVGVTKLDLQERFNQHCRPSSNCTILSRAIQKHGKENFKIELICKCDLKVDAVEAEISYIQILGTANSKNGYNLKSGGDYVDGHSDFTRKKMSKSHTGVKRGPMSKEQREKLSRVRIERGIRLSPESIEKGRLKNLGRKFPKSFSEQISNRQRGSDNPVAKSVKASTGEVFGTIVEAAKWCGLTPASIGHCVRGVNKTAGLHPETKERLSWTYHKKDNI